MSPLDTQGTSELYITAATRAVAVTGAALVYRFVNLLGSRAVPLVVSTHLGADLDSWDPEIVDPLAAERAVFLLRCRGAGSSTGTVQDSVEAMAEDVAEAIRALGLSHADLFGLSMGGMVAPAVLRRAPDLVDRVILSTAGPQGGPGLTSMTGVMVRDLLGGVATFTSPTSLPFATRTPVGRQGAKAYRARLRRCRIGRDAPVTPTVLRAQLRAVARWGRTVQEARGRFTTPALIFYGDADRMVPVQNVAPLPAEFADARPAVFSDAGHGVEFQNHQAVTTATLDFLRR